VKELLESTCDRERVGIIFNPVSGTDDPGARRSSLEALARQAGLACGLTETDADRGAGPLAEQAVADGLERVIVAGGDGSVTEAAHALVGTETSLAVVPGGTGNLFALNLGIPTDPEDAMRLALNGEVRRLDAGRANGAVFLVAAGMGLDARTMRDADRALKDRYGKLAYVIATVRNLGRHHIPFTITIDGRPMRRSGQSVLVANLGRITAGLELVPDSDPDDGLLDVAILRTRRLRDLVLLALRALLGLARSDDLLEVHHGRHIVVETAKPQPVQIDGDEIGATTRLEVTVEPSGLNLVCPPSGEEVLPPVAVVAEARRKPCLVPVVGAAAALVGWLVRRRRAAPRSPVPLGRRAKR
jgi:YegS/Rv2252/BmrU family lipid kinase